MEYCKPARLFVLLLLLGTSTLNAAEAPRVYRYVDDDGKLVFNSFIPAEFAKNGYTILNQRGLVLEEIPRTLTPAEQTARTAELDKQRLEEEARIARKEADNFLLRVFRTPADIEHKRDRDLAELDTGIAALITRLKQLDQDIAQLAQNSESAELAQRQAEREELDTELLTLTAKRENAAYGFEQDIERLAYLQALAKNTAAN